MDVDEKSFQKEVLDKSKTVPVVVDFWASWCGPCRMLAPVLEKIEKESKGKFVLAKVNVDLNQSLAQKFSVMSIPAVKMIWKGKVVDEFVGAQPEESVKAWLKKAQNLK
jgi:putative thioredoxin